MDFRTEQQCRRRQGSALDQQLERRGGQGKLETKGLGLDDRVGINRKRPTHRPNDKPPAFSEICELAHDLKNLILHIQTATDLLLCMDLMDSAKHYLRSILEHTERMNLLVEDVLTGRDGVVHCRSVNLTELVSQVAYRVRQTCPAGISCLYPRIEPILVSANEVRLWRALYNLVLNAAQAATPSGAVEVRLSLEPTQTLAWVEVVDTGPGIPPGDQDRVFEPFFTTKHTGKGLGLTVAKRFIEEIGGQVSFSSKPGRGTVFKVSLPLARSPHS